jgi:hypothetical protein
MLAYDPAEVAKWLFIADGIVWAVFFVFALWVIFKDGQ